MKRHSVHWNNSLRALKTKGNTDGTFSHPTTALLHEKIITTGRNIDLMDGCGRTIVTGYFCYVSSELANFCRDSTGFRAMCSPMKNALGRRINDRKILVDRLDDDRWISKYVYLRWLSVYSRIILRKRLGNGSEWQYWLPFHDSP